MKDEVTAPFAHNALARQFLYGRLEIFQEDRVPIDSGHPSLSGRSAAKTKSVRDLERSAEALFWYYCISLHDLI